MEMEKDKEYRKKLDDHYGLVEELSHTLRGEIFRNNMNSQVNYPINLKRLDLALAVQTASCKAERTIMIKAYRKDSAYDALEFPNLIGITSPGRSRLDGLTEKLCLSIGTTDQKFVFLRMNVYRALTTTQYKGRMGSDVSNEPLGRNVGLLDGFVPAYRENGFDIH